MKGLRISPDLSLPLDVVTQSIGVVAQRGSGKTYLSAVLCEELIGAGLPVVVLDPIGVYYGLRSSADGKREGLPVVILGGDHGDVPLEPGAGKVIADWVIAERRPAVLDLSLFRKGEQRQFVTDFAEELYRKNRDPLHLVLDEADLFAPQRPQPGEQRMLGAFEDLVRRGRARGIGLTLITQRPATIHKDVLTQVSALIALRLVGPQDRRAVEDWISVHGDEAGRKEVLGSLASLPIGTAWFWSPGWLGILKKVRVRERTTFDSSKTPTAGARVKAPEKLAPVDLAALTERIAATIERAKADDPKALRARIAELERKLAKKPATTVERVEMPAKIDWDQIDRWVLARLEDGIKATRLAVGNALIDMRVVNKGEFPPPDAVMPRRAVTPESKPERARRHPQAASAPRASSPGEKMPGAERKLLTVLAQVGRPLSKKRLAVRAGYAHNGGGFNSALGALRTKGWASGKEEIEATSAGLDALGAFERLPEGRDLLEYWIREGSRAEALILRALDEAGGAASKEAVAKATGYEATGGGFNNALGRLRSLELIEGRGELRLSEELVG